MNKELLLKIIIKKFWNKINNINLIKIIIIRSKFPTKLPLLDRIEN